MDGDRSCGRVRVFARVRPTTDGSPCGVQFGDDGRSLRVVLKNDSMERAVPGEPLAVEAREFHFDKAFPMHAAQEEVFTQAGLPVLRECLRGCNGTIFAYGQTGSGKTHSLLHPGREGVSDTGLLPRLVTCLFDEIDHDAKSVYKVEAAAMQVYNEHIDDLLHPDYASGGGHNLAVQSGGSVPSLEWTRCQKPDQLLGVFDRARSNIVYAETKMNKASSRSHAVFQVKLTKLGRADSQSGVVECTCACLSIVDLAGSERVKKSGVEGVHFREATAINKSLLALGNVVSALAAKRTHVPFRDSKLTRILSGLIGGNCKTILLVCVNPLVEHVQETWSSLEFASRAMHIEVHARVNCIIQVNAKALFSELSAERDAEKWRLAAEDRALQATSAQDAAREATARAERAESGLLDATARAERAEAQAVQAEARASEATARAERAEAQVAGAADVEQRVLRNVQSGLNVSAGRTGGATTLEATFEAMQQEVRRLEAELAVRGEELKRCTAALAASKAAIVTASDHASAAQAQETWVAKERAFTSTTYASAFEAQRADFEKRFCAGDDLETPLADLVSEVSSLRQKLQSRNGSCPTTPARPSIRRTGSEKQPLVERKEVRRHTAPLRGCTVEQARPSSARCCKIGRKPLSSSQGSATDHTAGAPIARGGAGDQHSGSSTAVDRLQQRARQPAAFSAEPRKSLQAVFAGAREPASHTPRSRTPTTNRR